MKIFYFDVETTGFSATENDIIQISAIVEIDGVEKQTFNSYVKPFNMENISASALEVNNIRKEDIDTFPNASKVYRDLVLMLGKYVNKYNTADKFVPAGYNVAFDVEFLRQFFIKNNDKYFGSWFSAEALDPLPLLRTMDAMGKIFLRNYKLSTVCEHYGIEIKAHDAFEDIKATKKIIALLQEKLDGVTL